MSKNSVASLVLFILLATCCFQFAAAYADSDSMMAAEKSFLQGKYEQAIIESDRLIDARVNKRYEVYYIKGLSELKSGRYADARKTFSNIIEKYPSSPRVFEANIGIGDSYYLAGNKEAASSIYADVVKSFPNDENIAIARERLGMCKSGERTIVPEKIIHQDAVPAVPHFTPKEMPRGDAMGGVSIQVGSFKSKKNAEGLSKKLQKQGYESYVEIPVTSGDKLYRVKVGHFASRQDAEKLAARLKVRGYPTKICQAASYE